MPYQLDQTEMLKTLKTSEKELAEHLAVHKGNIEMFAEQITEGAFPAFSVVRQHDDLVHIEDWVQNARNKFQHLIVVGMGGSSLGGMVLSGFSSPAKGTKPTLHFINNPDPVVIDTLCRDLPLKDTGILAISKSGGTIETLLVTGLILDAFRAHDVSARGRAWAVTESSMTPLAQLVQGQGGHLLRHDPKIGGRYSVFSNVGLLPGVIAGIDGRQLRKGAQHVLSEFCHNPSKSLATVHALGANQALREGYRSEVLMPYGQQLSLLADWWAQIWAESLGKDSRGTTPIKAVGSTDQHSQLQLYADGPNDKLYTFVTFAEKRAQTRILSGTMASLASKPELNGLSAGRLLQAQAHATAASLAAGGRPVRMITLEDRSNYSFGALLMHMMLTTVVAGIMWRVDPFDQPAVEDSKRRTTELLKA
ncbi:MAG: glucose-6-phosphate isomerase [Magnetococcales bacterium]|nr:glucose-6-phosphate isomerase [Magnetococcales bacterium]|tara:strand:+ start:520176 stop:521438 length:1263 start_codon:yes stop_codon:yes gene_type:complete